jgi:hypothetical protein
MRMSPKKYTDEGLHSELLNPLNIYHLFYCQGEVAKNK